MSGDRGGGQHRGRHGSRGHYYGRSHSYGHHSYYPRSPFYWYGFYYPFYYGHYGYGYPSYGTYDRYRSSSAEPLGALDLDIKPEEAEVYVDGRLVGIADNFDGYPSYLWLEPGTYQVAFYKEGFETLTREVQVTPETTLDFDDQLISGTAVKPEPPAKPTRAEARRDPEAERQTESWRTRAREYKARKEPTAGKEALDVRGEPGHLFLVVRPADASVYLDGRFLGTAEELSGLHGGLIVNPGEHKIEVVHPDYASASKIFSIDAGGEIDLNLRLEGGEDGA